MTHIPPMDTFLDPLLAAADRACRLIPPAFPLSATVAVNPFLGHAGEPLEMVAARMSRIGGPRPFMPRSWYREMLDSGEITTGDLTAALVETRYGGSYDPETIRVAAAQEPPEGRTLPTLAEIRFGGFEADRAQLPVDCISTWAQSFFDEGQAMWRPQEPREAYANWREYATHDLTPELLGLSGFCARVRASETDVRFAVGRALAHLGIDPSGAESYCHQLLMRLGGWAQAAAYRRWVASHDNRDDLTILGLFAAMLAFETAVFDLLAPVERNVWADAASRHREPVSASKDDKVDAILQAAFEASDSRRLSKRLSGGVRPRLGPAAVKAFFCIDVRSEVFRRAFESVSPNVETGGFAGFFGVPTAHRRFASDVVEQRLPVLLPPKVCTHVTEHADTTADTARRISERARRALARFSAAAVASFAYVEAVGLGYASKLATGSAGIPLPLADKMPPRFDESLPLATRVEMARSILRAMSMTRDFPRTVLLLGHGAGVVNNPFASALQCGACGGHAGDVNARLLASLLNDPFVRRGLADEGIAIPEETAFVAGLHDTTADTVELFEDGPEAGHVSADLRRWLHQAGVIARTERAALLPGASSAASVQRRGTDWAELRPEWGLAGCSAFIAAPRAVTRPVSLEGRAFLHDYDWRSDDDFGVLELILTAPVVVASWINLQYYGSAVSPQAFGSGNKLLHNAVGGMGVIEGNGGNLRTGLPWQSVHDGARLTHPPVRLTVFLAAPTGAVGDVLNRHSNVRSLFDHGWLKLATLDDAGSPAMRYRGALKWEPV